MNQASFLKKVIAFLSLVSLALFGAIYFVYQEIKIKNEKVSSVEQDLSQKSTRYDYLLSTKKLIENIELDIKKIDNSVVGKSGDVAFIEDLELLAKSNGLKIEIESLNLENDSKNASSTITTLKVKAKTEGDWVGMYSFVSEIESLPIKIKINRFALITEGELTSSQAKPVDQNKNWQGSFEISVLKYK